MGGAKRRKEEKKGGEATWNSIYREWERNKRKALKATRVAEEKRIEEETIGGISRFEPTFSQGGGTEESGTWGTLDLLQRRGRKRRSYGLLSQKQGTEPPSRPHTKADKKKFFKKLERGNSVITSTGEDLRTSLWVQLKKREKKSPAGGGKELYALELKKLSGRKKDILTRKEKKKNEQQIESKRYS